MRKPLVVLGIVGTKLDAGAGRRRQEPKWRPTVSLCSHAELHVDRLELLHDPRFVELAEGVARDVKKVSPDTEVRLHAVETNNPWDFEEVYGALHDFARGYAFDTERESYLVHITTGTHVAQICLFLLTESRHLPGKLIQTAPSRTGEAGPGAYAVIDLDLSRYDRLASRFLAEQRDGVSALKAGIATKNPAYNALIERIEQVTLASRSPMLLTGPTGAGKSQLARRIYELLHARRKITGPFVEVNCATLRGDTAMGALFGHTKGAYTGAQSAREGLLRRAHGGMLFLDEVGELGLDEQAMLLRALEDKTFLPVGSDREVSSDFRLLAGTNRDLVAARRAGTFREDLLARIDLWTFELPALSQRLEDLGPNLDFELERAGTALGRHVTMSKEARAKYLAFGTAPGAAWPGNFRDLAGSVMRLGTLAPGGRITHAAVVDETALLARAWAARRGEGSQPTLSRELLGARLDELDRFDVVQLDFVLATCARSRTLSDAGRTLFEKSLAKRASVNDADRLRKYLARFGLSWADVGPRG